MGYLGKDDILAVDDRHYRDVEVPEWGGTVRLRGLSGKERDEIEASIVGQDGKRRNFANLRARMCAASIVDEAGERVFSRTDIQALGEKSAAALDRVFSAAQELSGMSDKDVDELVGESEPGLSGSSTSA